MDYNEVFEYRDGKLFSKITERIINGSDHKGYRRYRINNKNMRLHRIIWEMLKGKIPSGLQVDHINGKKDDNRIENLQLLTNEQNTQRNRNSKGYTIDKKSIAKPYRAQKMHKSKWYCIGFYGTPAGAYMANRMFFINQTKNG